MKSHLKKINLQNKMKIFILNSSNISDLYNISDIKGRGPRISERISRLQWLLGAAKTATSGVVIKVQS